VPTATPDDPNAIRLGFFAPMSGVQASFGNDAINGARLAVAEINADGGILEHPLKLIVRDTRSRADETGEVVRQLLDDDKVVALIGEIATDRSLIAAPLAQEKGVPMITPGSTNENVTATGDQIFRICYTDSFQAGVMAEFARSINVEKAAILYDPSDPYSAGLAEKFKADFVSNGGQIVAEEFYQKGDRDFSTQLDAIKGQNPEIVFLPSYYNEAALIIRQARETGIDMPVLGTDGWDSPEFLKVGGEAVNNCYFSSHFSPDGQTGKSFVAAYTAKYGTPPPPLAALTYDAVKITADGLRRAGVAESIPLRDALAVTKDFAGVTGPISFDQDRNPTKPGIVIRLQDGKFTYLETVDAKVTEAPVAEEGTNDPPAEAVPENAAKQPQ
jgi:branched-chain amino acid transport system substrate-binding protein